MTEFLADDMPIPDDTSPNRSPSKTKAFLLCYLRRIVAFFRDSKLRRLSFRRSPRRSLSFQPLEETPAQCLPIEEDDLTLLEADTDFGDPELEDKESLDANNFIEEDDWSGQKLRSKFWKRSRNSKFVSDGLELVLLRRTRTC